MTTIEVSLYHVPTPPSYITLMSLRPFLCTLLEREEMTGDKTPHAKRPQTFVCPQAVKIILQVHSLLSQESPHKP